MVLFYFVFLVTSKGGLISVPLVYPFSASANYIASSILQGPLYTSSSWAHPKPPQSRCPGLPCPSHSPSLMSRTEPTVCRALQASLLRLGAAQLPPLTLLSPQTPDPAPFPRTLGNWPGCCSESPGLVPVGASFIPPPSKEMAPFCPFQDLNTDL